jgi:lysophospholipase L1-like esterase
VTLVLFIGTELALRGAYFARNSVVDYVVLPYNAAQDFGPIPPWIDNRRILERDEVLFWRNRRNVQAAYMDVFSPVHEEKDRTALLRQFFPDLPDSLTGNPVWNVALNSRGFRNTEFPTEKRPGALRILGIGDSWTFGANVDQSEAYPQILSSLLGQEFSTADFEVLNLGVFAYTSHQGLLLLKTQALDLDPDIVLIGFGMNDASVAGYRDKDLTDHGPSLPGRILENIEVYELYQYLAQIANYKYGSIGMYMRKVAEVVGTPDEAWIGREGHEQADYDSLESYTRVSPIEYEKNIKEMIDLARNEGAEVILLYNQLWDTPYREALRRLSEQENVPLVDSKVLIDEAKSKLGRDLEQRLQLIPQEAKSGSNGDATDIVFRVYSGDYPVQEAMYIAGIHPMLGDGVPNAVRMYDDGSNGDQRAGDRVWSYSVSLPVGETILYVYTNSGPSGQWVGLDVPDIRRVTVPPANDGTTVYRPIDTFGEIYMQADGWHTNGAGYELIARAVLQELKRNPKFRSHVTLFSSLAD